MFPSSASTSEHAVYDFDEKKWENVFVESLEKVHKEVHQSLEIKKDALLYVEQLIVKMLAVLCSVQPQSVAAVEERVLKKIPHPIDVWAMRDARAAVAQPLRNKKVPRLALPVDKIHQTLVKDVFGVKIDHQVSVYIAAVLEYIAADILKLAGNYVKNIRHSEITVQDIRVAMCADKVLMEMFFQDDEDDAIAVEEENPQDPRRAASLTYEELVKDLILEENQFLRDLNMIIRVFRADFVKLYPRSKDIEVIFSNILDIHELTQNLISSLDDVVEATEEGGIPLIGSCFDDIIEGDEFNVYEKYADDVLKDHGRMRISALLQNNDAIRTFKSSGPGCKDAAKYVLPGLLLGPIYHFMHFSDSLKVLMEKSPDAEDKQLLLQLNNFLNPLKTQIEKLMACKSGIKRKASVFTGNSMRIQGRSGTPMTTTRMAEIQKSIDGWEGKDIGQSCTYLLMEGALQKTIGRRMTERYVFLFDGQIILTKPNTKRSSVTALIGEYKLKERFHIRKIDIHDLEDTDELKNAFDLHVRDAPNIVLVAKTPDDKFVWMSHLVQLSTWSMLERLLDTKMKEAESQLPLRLPSPDVYIFAEEDSEDNIVFEENQDTKECPLIRGGTLPKLVERLTYHTYADPKFVRTFLTTFRTFCSQDDLLDLLIKRFNIPDLPSTIEDGDPMSEQSLQAKEEKKRFRTEYSKPVRFRVLNVLRHWVDQHWYDFHSSSLLDKLQAFLDSVKGKAMKKWVETICKIIERKSSQREKPPKHISYKTKHPPIEWHLTKELSSFDIMTLHPIEIARQVTLMEFELYQAIMPSELVGTVWMKKDKYRSSQNLLSTIQQSTKFTFWLEKCIVEAENFEERVSVLTRIIEVMLVLEELNNFTGILEVVSALNSAPIHRLKYTIAEVDKKLMKGFSQLKDLNDRHSRKLIDKLRSIDPPCVPFLGVYLTTILLTEEGNPDFLLNRPTEIINFSKRRKVAEITAEIQQYQNQPYCLTVEPSIRSYLDSLDPLGDLSEKEFVDYLYQKSLDIEPRQVKQLPKFDRKRDYALKSPGIKPQAAARGGITNAVKGARVLPPQLPATVANHTDGGHDNDLSSSETDLGTPPTPSTPMTPPHDSTDVGSVFNDSAITNFTVDGSLSSRCSSTSTLVSVMTAVSVDCPPTPSLDGQESLGYASACTEDDDRPPALPPRQRGRDSSSGILSPFWRLPQNDTASVLSDESIDDLPPALPPRLPPRVSHISHAYSHGMVPPPSPPAVNEVKPELPPKTYRHFRQSSS